MGLHAYLTIKPSHFAVMCCRASGNFPSRSSAPRCCANFWTDVNSSRKPNVMRGEPSVHNGKWTLVSFTSEVEGSPHHRCISNYADLGLDHSSYVWHECQKVHKSQIVSHIGWVNHDLIRVVRSGVDVRQVTISKLVEIADTHHSEYQDTTSAAWV